MDTPTLLDVPLEEGDVRFKVVLDVRLLLLRVFCGTFGYVFGGFSPQS